MTPACRQSTIFQQIRFCHAETLAVKPQTQTHSQSSRRSDPPGTVSPARNQPLPRCPSLTSHRHLPRPSPTAFTTSTAHRQVLPRVPALLDQLRQEAAGRTDSADFSQTADLVYTLMRLHPSCVQRYATVVRALQVR